MSLNIGGRVHRPTSPLSIGGRRIVGVETSATGGGGGITPGDQNRIDSIEAIPLDHGDYQSGSATGPVVANGHQVVQIGTGENAIWKSWVPRSYDNRDLALAIAWSSTGTDGSAFVEFNVSFQTINPGRVATDNTFGATQTMLQSDTATPNQIDYIFRLWTHAEMNSFGDAEQFQVQLARVAPAGRTDVIGDVDIYGLFLYATF